MVYENEETSNKKLLDEIVGMRDQMESSFLEFGRSYNRLIPLRIAKYITIGVIMLQASSLVTRLTRS